MSPDPTLPFADGPGAIGTHADPVLVDPSPSLLTAAVEAYREAAPGLVDPDPSTLRAEAEGDSPALSETLPSELPTLTVLASDRAADAVVDRFHPASRLAALVEAEVWDLLTLPEPQPNAALVGRTTGFALVPAEGSKHENTDAGDGPETWCRVGDDPTLRERYAPLVEAAEVRGVRTPSRRRAYEALRERCGLDVAGDAIRALDAGVVDGDALDLAGARRRAYVVGVQRGALDRDLRRACEDAGLGSSATFTRIKRELRDAGLLGTESVPQRVGRPRERLVARGGLADADGPIEAVAAALDAV
ncbi:DUF5821 family protein [Halorubrum sp. CBA1229]|uniref:transcriptional regulator TbsP domain-containing protein n=1 Tax=Halorubrum sp. CBA1229 TaxID=1853699 RepID=UPI000F40EE3B|nr:DUF5821 family protein [Halorubrum sp. CBA1229]QKY15414.1 hypothetical protein Hrr1229_000385 [Halorubrum sp. CBA1229]